MGLSPRRPCLPALDASDQEFTSRSVAPTLEYPLGGQPDGHPTMAPAKTRTWFNFLRLATT